MVNDFWHRWSKEVLHELQKRVKWLEPDYTLQVGDLALIVDELLPPTQWSLARITEVHPGADGLVRVVSVKTATSSFVRAVNKLVKLPVSEVAQTTQDDQSKEMCSVVAGGGNRNRSN